MKKANQEIKSFRLDFYVQSMIFFGVETNVFHPLKKKIFTKKSRANEELFVRFVVEEAGLFWLVESI